MTALPNRVSDRVMVRVPDGMRDDLKIRAISNRRTLGGEILHLIERALEAEKATTGAEA